MLKDYDMSLHYHSGKANVVVNALSGLSMGSLSFVDKEKWDLVKDIHHLDNLEIHLLDFEDGDMIVQDVVKSSLGAEVNKSRFWILS